MLINCSANCQFALFLENIHPGKTTELTIRATVLYRSWFRSALLVLNVEEYLTVSDSTFLEQLALKAAKLWRGETD
jgi:hypothetical protein